MNTVHYNRALFTNNLIPGQYECVSDLVNKNGSRLDLFNMRIHAIDFIGEPEYTGDSSLFPYIQFMVSKNWVSPVSVPQNLFTLTATNPSFSDFVIGYDSNLDNPNKSRLVSRWHYPGLFLSDIRLGDKLYVSMFVQNVDPVNTIAVQMSIQLTIRYEVIR